MSYQLPCQRYCTAGYTLFILRDIPDSCPMVMESSLKMLGSFLTHWKSILTNESTKVLSLFVTLLVIFCVAF